MELSELRNIIKRKYYHLDVGSGPLFLLAVLFEEVGELAEAVRKNDVQSVEEELADVLFMILSLSNLFNVEPEKRIIEKYVEGDPSSRWDLPNL